MQVQCAQCRQVFGAPSYAQVSPIPNPSPDPNPNPNPNPNPDPDLTLTLILTLALSLALALTLTLTLSDAQVVACAHCGAHNQLAQPPAHAVPTAQAYASAPPSPPSPQTNDRKED